MMISDERVGGLIGMLQRLPEAAIYNHDHISHSVDRIILCYGSQLDYGRNRDYNKEGEDAVNCACRWCFVPGKKITRSMRNFE